MTESTLTFGGPAGSRSWVNAVRRGIHKKCPQCGQGGLFSGYTATVDQCSNCDLDLTGHQADDAPPYFTILIVGHASIPLALAAQQLFEPPMWLQFTIWLPLILLAAVWLLPIAKGALIGLQWAKEMHGFARTVVDLDADVPKPSRAP